MGCAENITHANFPSQGGHHGARVSVCYHYDTTLRHSGVCVRDDREQPYITAFMLDCGRLVLATECQYQVVREEAGSD